jgi:hypothetical protein
MLPIVLSLLLAAPVALAPVISPAAGTYIGTQSITVKALSAGSVVRCTADGTDPSTSTARYAAPITVSATATVKCKAWVQNKRSSPVASAAYTIQAGNSGTPQALYAAASLACASMPIRSTGTKTYFCDCQAGAEAGCVAGNDANAGTSASSPKQTFGALRTKFNTLAAGDTVAMCKGGSFTGVDTNILHNTACSAAADPRVAANTTTCDIRDYAPSWGGTAKPIISFTTGQDAFPFRNATSSDAGVRILNLDLRSSGANQALSGYGPRFDYFACNNTMTGWNIAAYFATVDSTKLGSTRFLLVGNRILNSGQDAWLGGGSQFLIDANYMDDNGASNSFDHAIYVSGYGAINAAITNNEIRYSTKTCQGVVVVIHGQYDGLNIENNIIDGGTRSTGGCWGVQAGNGGYSSQGYYRNVTVKRNLIMNGGNLALGLDQSPGHLVENNVIVMRQSGRGIVNPEYAARTAYNEPVSSGTIRNNTVYFPAGTTSSGAIVIGQLNEGTGWVIANNTVYFGSGTSTTCFVTPRPAGAYTFVGNNACYQGTWGTTYDGTTHITANPLYTNAPTDFTPQAASPLNGAGAAALAPATDINLKVRPNPPAIGAVER